LLEREAQFAVVLYCQQSACLDAVVGGLDAFAPKQLHHLGAVDRLVQHIVTCVKLALEYLICQFPRPFWR